MSDQSQPIFDLVRDSAPSARWAAAHWEGSFQEYLQLVESRPILARNAWQRLLDMIESHGCVKPKRRGAPVRWKLFDDPLG